MEKLFLILFSAFLSTSKYLRNVNENERERLEEALISKWAEDYVKEFFTPTPMSTSPINLGRYVVKHFFHHLNYYLY